MDPINVTILVPHDGDLTIGITYGLFRSGLTLTRRVKLLIPHGGTVGAGLK